MNKLRHQVSGCGFVVAVSLLLFISIFALTPLSARAETVPDNKEAYIAQLLELVRTLQAKVAALIAARDGSGSEGGSVTNIKVGDTVVTTDVLKVRSNPSVDSTLLTTMEPLAQGKVVEGPKSADGYSWWKVAYHKVTGWSAGNWLRAHKHAENKVTKDKSGHVAPKDKSEHEDSDENGDAPSGAVWIDGNDNQEARTLPNSKTTPTTAPFRQDFTGNTGKSDFRYGVFHAGVGFQELGYPARIWGDNNAQNGHGGHWTADHDMNCGTPATQRSLSSSASDFNLDEIFFLCKDHIMSSVGDVDGYSLAWFSPKKSFSRATHKTVSWDVNVTDLFGRQWWEVSIVPKGGHVVATIDWNSRGDLIPYDDESIIIGNGPFGGGVNMITNGENQYDDWRPICDGEFALDPVGCKDKMIRRPFSVTDNNNGTLTVNYAGLYTQTIPGKLPEEFDVYFTDHNYTPDKDGVPPGHTWHWDTIHVE